MTGVFLPGGYQLSALSGDTVRKGVTATLQFKPSKQWLFTLDGLWDRYQLNTQTASIAHFIGPANVASASVDANQTVVNLTTNNFGHTDFVSQYDHTPTTVKGFGFNTQWQSANGLLALNLDLSGSTALADGPNNTAFTVIGYRNVVNWSYGGSGIPSVVALGDPSIGVPGGTFTDTSLGHAHFASRGGNRNADEIKEGKFDGVLNLDAGVLSKMKLGIYFSDRTKSDDTYSTNASASGAYGGYNLPIPTSTGLLSVFNAGSGFLSGHGGTIPTQWLTFNPDAYFAYLSQPSTAAAQDQVLGLPPGTTLAKLGSAGFTAVKQAASYTVEEKVKSFYLETDFAGTVVRKPWSINAGVRYAHTELQASGTSQQLLDLLPIPNDLTAYTLVYQNGGAQLPVTADNTYNDLLPSVNAKINWTDNVITRLALSKSLARPDITNLAPRVTITGNRPGNLTASGGNPNLKPYACKNADLTFEWYVRRGSSLTIGLFYKDIQDFVITTNTSESFPVQNAGGNFPTGYAPFTVRRPQNGDTAKVKGLEIALQHTFIELPAPFDGLGLLADATFVNSNATLDPGQTTKTFALQGLGNTQNLVTFYEKGALGMRLAYNHRDAWLQTAIGVTGEPTFVKGAGQLDGQISYKLDQHLIVTLEGSNLTDTVQEQYGRYKNQFVGLTDSGTRYALGLRANF